jgi:hypothetical protein
MISDSVLQVTNIQLAPGARPKPGVYVHPGEYYGVCEGQVKQFTLNQVHACVFDTLGTHASPTLDDTIRIIIAPDHFEMTLSKPIIYFSRILHPDKQDEDAYRRCIPPSSRSSSDRQARRLSRRRRSSSRKRNTC